MYSILATQKLPTKRVHALAHTASLIFIGKLLISLLQLGITIKINSVGLYNMRYNIEVYTGYTYIISMINHPKICTVLS